MTFFVYVNTSKQVGDVEHNVLVIPTMSASIASCVLRPGRNPYENPRKSSS